MCDNMDGTRWHYAKLSLIYGRKKQKQNEKPHSLPEVERGRIK